MDHSHQDVAQFFNRIRDGGYDMLYLTARAIGQAAMTRDYLFTQLAQYDDTDRQRMFMLPQGPVIMAPDSLLRAGYREIIQKKPQDFKIPALTDIRDLFPQEHNP